jgi:hypothetical protein
LIFQKHVGQFGISALALFYVESIISDTRAQAKVFKDASQRYLCMGHRQLLKKLTAESIKNKYKNNGL